MKVALVCVSQVFSADWDRACVGSDSAKQTQSQRLAEPAMSKCIRTITESGWIKHRMDLNFLPFSSYTVREEGEK